MGREPCRTIGAENVGGLGYYHLEVDVAKKIKLDPNKPPFAVPTMAEIEAVPWNGLTAVSTFSGAGGTCLGLRMAGFRVLWASEFHGNAADTYEANFSNCIVDRRDIREVEADEILDAAGLGAGELDLLDGSPPCDSFSTAGKRQKYWGKEKNYSGGKRQRTDDLFFEYVRLLDGLQPRVFIAENVSGLVKGKAKGYFKEILAAMKGAGYRVAARLLDAQWLGVPQQRQRIIFVGVREDLGLDPAHPSPLRFRYSVADALPWLVGAGSESHGPNSWDNDLSVDAPGPTVIQSGPNAGQYYRHHVEVVHDTSGEWGQGEVTDKPCPAVTVGVDALNSRHYQVVVRKGRGFGDEEWVDAGDVSADSVGAGPASGNNEGNNAHAVGVRLIHDEAGDWSRGDVTDGCAPTGRSGRAGTMHVENPEADMTPYAVRREFDRLAPGEKSGKYLNLVRSDSVAPSPTVTQAGGNASTASVTHPVERRKFYISELKRICAFPDDFVLLGSYAERWRSCGMAVPPVMAFFIARTIRDEILLRADGGGPWPHDPEWLREIAAYRP